MTELMKLHGEPLFKPQEWVYEVMKTIFQILITWPLVTKSKRVCEVTGKYLESKEKRVKMEETELQDQTVILLNLFIIVQEVQNQE